MSDISSLLNNMYANNQTATGIEKTAEDNLLLSLMGEGQVVEENPLVDWTTEELIKQAAALEGQAQGEESTELLEKTAAEMLGGQIMAHAMVDEMGLMKEAMLSGNCRVCKANPLDTEGVSICTGCIEASQ